MSGSRLLTGLRVPRLLATPRLPRPPASGLITLAPAFLLLGAMFASVDLSTVAFSTERGLRPVAGLVLGSIALGSAVGGLWYGSRHWRAPLGRRFVTTGAFAVLGISTFWAMPGLLALAAVGFVSGMWIAPTVTAGYAILEAQAPPHRQTESMAWLSSTISVGVALGSAVAGHIIDAHGARFGFGVGAACGIAAILVTLAGQRKLTTAASADREAISSTLGHATAD
jgi:MFS family permease